ncbi:TATA box-binding protein-associated factor RNA polymerase I subunit B isoform X2 [Stigmatopora nigra]
MDQQEDYQEACLQCGSVRWSVSDEGRFFCTVCHNVIERTQETAPQTPRRSRVTTTGPSKRLGRACRWRMCEGFQFVLIEQATALVRLGAHPDFKDRVLWPLWRRFLQTRRQAYTHARRGHSEPPRAVDSDSETDATGSETDATGSSFPSDSDTDYASESDAEGPSGSSAGGGGRSGSSAGGMTMRKTLALVHLALVWSRQALTLGDLIGLAANGDVPYLEAYLVLPEEMKLDVSKASLFTAQRVPSHRELLREARTLLRLLRLPAFPEIHAWDPLHPRMLSLRYLADANLPDQLHPWVCALWERTSQPPGVLPAYDLQAAALVLLALKILFGLDDRREWDLSDDASAVGGFSPRRWYRLLRAAKLRAQRREEKCLARKPWKATSLFRRGKRGRVDVKRKRNAEQVKLCFERLRTEMAEASPLEPPPPPPASSSSSSSSFTFLWGAGCDADGPSLRGTKATAVPATFWRSPLGSHSRWKRGAHYAWTEATLPRSFAWVLELFAFLLRVSPAQLYWEESNVEKRVLAARKWRPSSSLFGQRRRKRKGNPSF